MTKYAEHLKIVALGAVTMFLFRLVFDLFSDLW